MPAVGTLVKEMYGAQHARRARQELKANLIKAFTTTSPAETNLRAYLVEQIMEVACALIREYESETDPGDLPRLGGLHVDLAGINAPAGRKRYHCTPAWDKRVRRETRRANMPIYELVHQIQHEAQDAARVYAP